jgi:hypothetical protein
MLPGVVIYNGRIVVRGDALVKNERPTPLFVQDRVPRNIADSVDEFTARSYRKRPGRVGGAWLDALNSMKSLS